MMLFIFKAKRKGVVGERRKWADGVYIKGDDHKWHKEKLEDHAHDQLKEDKRHNDKKLVSDFKEACVKYVQHLADLNRHPEDATPTEDGDFWAEFFDDEDWDKKDGYFKYAQKAVAVAKKFHGHLTQEGKSKEKSTGDGRLWVKRISDKEFLLEESDATPTVFRIKVEPKGMRLYAGDVTHGLYPTLDGAVRAAHFLYKKGERLNHWTEPKKENPPKKAPRKEKIAEKKKIEQAASFKFSKALDYDNAKRAIARRKFPFEMAKKLFDGKPVTDYDYGLGLIGLTVEMNGVQGVITSFRYARMLAGHSSGGRRRFSKGKIVSLTMLTARGQMNVTNSGNLKIIADPTGPTDLLKHRVSESMSAVGVHTLVFDEGISLSDRDKWTKSLDSAFTSLNKAFSINLHGKIRIQVYSAKGPKRGATADYSSADKTIRLSTAKASSRQALAHELGHALDDKMNKWSGVGGWKINELVNAFRKTKQGKDEMEAQEQAKETSKKYREAGLRARRGSLVYVNWMNKPEEIFARCFESYIARNVPEWREEGWAKSVITDDTYEAIKPYFDKLLKSDDVKKALMEVLHAISG